MGLGLELGAIHIQLCVHRSLVFAELFPQCSEEDLGNAVVISVTDEDGVIISSGMLEEISSGEPVSVQVQFDFDAIRWLKGWEYFGFELVQSVAIGRRE